MKYKELNDRCNKLKIAEVGLELLGNRMKKRSISQDYSGLCPFHNEKNPSFFLKVKWNKYICFACEKGGNPLSLPFDYFEDEAEAISYLATKLKFDFKDKFSVAVFLNNLTKGEGLFRNYGFNWLGLETLLREECGILRGDGLDLFRVMSQFAFKNPEANNDSADNLLSSYLSSYLGEIRK